MGALPPATRVGTALLVAATVTAFARSFTGWNWPWDASMIAVALMLGSMIALAEVFGISFPHSSGTFYVSVGSPVALAAGLALGPFVGGAVVSTAILTESLYRRRTPIKTIVNVCNLGLVTILGAAVYRLLADAGQTPLGNLRNMAAVVVASLVFILVNATALSAIVAPIVGISPWRMLRTNLSGVYIEMLTLPTFGAIVPVLARESPVALLVLVVPLVGPVLAFRGFEKIGVEARETMEGLTDALERRDTYTYEHSVRVTGFAEAILREMPSVPLETAQGILTAARVHDLGKVAVRDRTLYKSGPLTPEERAEINGHPVVGAEIVERLWVYRPWAEVIRHHHERWDGRGYPDGLAGEAIPLGARIIAVADAFDAMTSDRPYRRALDRDIAVAELHAMGGSQFDPEVVTALGRALNCRTADAPAGATIPNGASAPALSPAASAPVVPVPGS